MPADNGTNLTLFVHSNIVQHPNCGGGSFSAIMSASGDGSDSETIAVAWASVPMAIPADGSGNASPIAIYPPGFDFSNYFLIDPSTDEWTSGKGISCGLSVNLQSLDDVQSDGPQPTGGDGSDPALDTGFYKVVRNGVYLIGVTNGMTLSGIVTIPVEAGNGSGQLDNLSLTEEGTPVSDVSIVSPPFQAPLQLVMDTTQMSNGVHQISANASWYISGADNPYYQATSLSLSINVYNEISFPNWMPQFGQEYDSLYIAAQSAHTNADWYIDVYGGDSGYIGTFGGHTYDGNIEIVWNLAGPPPTYQSYANEPYFEFVVQTFFDTGQNSGNGPQPTGSETAVTPKILKNWDKWAARGDWVVANQLFWGDWVGGDNLDTMTDGFVGMAEGFGLTVLPTHSYGEAFRIHYNHNLEVSNWQTFRQALYAPNSRNLFYSDHGSTKGIGYNAADTNVFITQAEIESVLRTVPQGQTNRHGFRFVFLDGCETANGHLPEALGVIQKENLPHTHYDNAGLRRSAFVGWNKSPAGGYANHLVDTDHWKFIQNFQYLWLTTGRGLRQCLNDAKTQGPAGWNDINPKHLTVFGCVDLGPNQHN